MTAADRNEVDLERWEERAALLEYHGDHSRPEAEREACRQLFQQTSLPAPLAQLRAQLAAKAQAASAKKKGKKKKRARNRPKTE